MQPHELAFEKFDENVYMQDTGTGKDSLARAKAVEILKELQFYNLLDVPCGTGVDYVVYKEAGLLDGVDYVGVDMTPKFIKYCKEKYGFTALLGDIRKLIFSDKSFDVVHARGVFEHLDGDDYKVAIAECLRVARKYAVLIFFRGAFDHKERVINPIGLVEQDYTQKEIEECFEDKEFKRYEQAAQNGNTYVIYVVTV